MKVLLYSSVIASALMIVGSQSVLAEAIDRAVRNALNEEAAATSLDKGVVVKELIAEPSSAPDPNVDYQALEIVITSQIKTAISDNNVERPLSHLQSQLEKDLENVVSSALVKGNQLNDIRSAVAAAMNEIQNTGDIEASLEKIKSTERALNEILSESTAITDEGSQDVYIQSLSDELKEGADQPKSAPLGSTMSMVEKIMATMPDTDTPDVKTKLKITPMRTVVASQASVSKPEKISKLTTFPVVETVTVLKGESLFKVAKRVYGSGANYLALYQANKDTISDPNIIRVGQVLRIPR